MPQDKYFQKTHFEKAGVPVAPYADAPDAAALDKAAQEFGFPLMLKSKRWVASGAGAAAASAAFGSRP
jgi:phosphoribosylaminoimidazole carboxylase